MNAANAGPAPALEVHLRPHDRVGALERIALALNSTLELREVLAALAGETLEIAGAARTSVFIIRGETLCPAASKATAPDEALWVAFQQMAPIALTPERAAVLRAGIPVVVTDPQGSPICPAEWIDRFAVRCAVLVPLLAGAEPCGLMAIDFPADRQFASEELRLLQAIGAFAGVAVRNAHTYQSARRTARLQAGLASAAAKLAPPAPPKDVARVLCAAATEILRAHRCLVVMRQEGRDDDLPSADGSASSGAPVLSFAAVPPSVRTLLEDVWASGPSHARIFTADESLSTLIGDDSARTVVVLPIAIGNVPAGAALLSFADTSPVEDETLAVAEALASIAAAALERHRLIQRQERQVQQLDILYRLSGSLAEQGDAKHLVEAINSLLRGTGVVAVELAFRSRNLKRHVAAEPPTSELRATWPHGDEPMNLLDGSVAVPMRLGRRVVGWLRAAGRHLDEEDLAFLEALAAGVAAVVQRGALRTSVEEARREKAMAAERERIAADLHDTVGQQFVALGLMAHRLAEQLPPQSPWAVKVRRLAAIAAVGKFEIDQAVRSLAFVPASRRGLVPAVRGLCAAVSTDSGLNVVVDIEGRPTRLPPSCERALYRVVHEALTNAWRHARCSTVRVLVSFYRDHVEVIVRDDGVGLANRAGAEGSGKGLWSMRRTMAAAGGSVHIRSAPPQGVEVTATLPKGSR